MQTLLSEYTADGLHDAPFHLKIMLS